MVDYVDVESLNAYQTLLEEGKKSQQETFQIIQAKSRDNSAFPCSGMLRRKCRIFRHSMVTKAGKNPCKYINVENEIRGPIFTFYQRLDSDA